MSFYKTFFESGNALFFFSLFCFVYGFYLFAKE